MTLKTAIGIVLMLAGVVLGLYVGVWLCLVGGIVDIVEVIKSQGIDAMKIAWGIVKVLCSGLFGMLSAYVLLIPGWAMLDN